MHSGAIDLSQCGKRRIAADNVGADTAAESGVVFNDVVTAADDGARDVTATKLRGVVGEDRGADVGGSGIDSNPASVSAVGRLIVRDCRVTNAGRTAGLVDPGPIKLGCVAADRHIV